MRAEHGLWEDRASLRLPLARNAADLQALMVTCCASGPMRRGRQPRSDAPDSGPTAPMRAEAIGRVAQNSALGLCEWQRLVFGRRHAKDVEDHRDHDVIAEDAHKLDRGGIAENGMHALENSGA